MGKIHSSYFQESDIISAAHKMLQNKLDQLIDSFPNVLKRTEEGK
jgi:hypothetical protein